MPELLRHLWLTGAALLVMVTAAPPVQAALPVTGAAATPDYWLRADGDEPLLSAEAGARASAHAALGLLHDLTGAGEFRAGSAVRAQIRAAAQGNDAALPELYEGGQPLTARRWYEVCRNCALDTIGAAVPIRTAVAVCRADVRLLPTGTGWYSSPNDLTMMPCRAPYWIPGKPFSYCTRHGTDAMRSLRRGTTAAGWTQMRSHSRIVRHGADLPRRRSSSP